LPFKIKSFAVLIYNSHPIRPYFIILDLPIKATFSLANLIYLFIKGSRSLFSNLKIKTFYLSRPEFIKN